MSGSVYLSDSYGKYFNFAVIDPNGHSIVQYEHADSKLWKFIAEMNGIYSLAVVNPSASATNSVTLEYSVVNNVPTNYSFASLLSLVVFGVVIAVGIGLAVVFLIIQSKPKASHKVLYS
jgi:sensor histidine kinase YesM